MSHHSSPTASPRREDEDDFFDGFSGTDFTFDFDSPAPTSSAEPSSAGLSKSVTSSVVAARAALTPVIEAAGEDSKTEDDKSVAPTKPTYAERSPFDLVKGLLARRGDTAAISALSVLACDMTPLMTGYLKRSTYMGFDPLGAGARIMRSIGDGDEAEFQLDQNALVGMCVWITRRGTKTTAKVMDKDLYLEIRNRLERIASRAGFEWSDTKASKGLSSTTLNLARFGQAAAPLLLMVQFALNMYGPVGTSLVESPNAGSFVTADCIGDHLVGMRKFYGCISGDKAVKLPKANILKAVLTSKGAPPALRVQLGFSGDRLRPIDFAGMESFDDVAAAFTVTGTYKQPGKITLFGREISCGEAAVL
jgi:hypothetical protein